MENNNPTPQAPIPPQQPIAAQPMPTPAPAAAPTTQPAAPTPQPTATPQTPVVNTGGSNKIVIYFVIGLIVIVVLIAGAYLFMSRQQQAAKITEPTTIETIPQPIVQATPRPQDTVDALDRDLSALNVGSTDSDFSSIDADLQQL